MGKHYADVPSPPFWTCPKRRAACVSHSPTLGGDQPPTTRHDRRPQRRPAQGVLCNNFATIHPQPSERDGEQPSQRDSCAPAGTRPMRRNAYFTSGEGNFPQPRCTRPLHVRPFSTVTVFEPAFVT